MKKKIFSIFLSLALMVTMMPAQTLVVSAATKTKATVSTQTGLKKALKNKKLKTLTVKTGKIKTFSIKKGTHKKVHMIIDAQKSTVKNKSIFKKITIKKNKTFVMDASKGSIAVSKGGKVNEVKLTKSNSKINFNVSGELKKINVQKKSEVSIKGTTKKAITVNAGENADETVIKTSVKVNAKIDSNAKVKLSDGSEGSSIVVTNKDVKVTVVNNTDSSYTAMDANGKTVEIKKDATVVIGGYTPGPTPPALTTYTVTFDMQGHGTQISPITNVASGSKISAPTAPTATGLIFKGWYKEAACSTAWNFSTDTITGNTTLYAKWTFNVEGILSTNTNFPTEANSGWTTSANEYHMYHCTDQARLMVYDISSAEAVSFVYLDIALSAEGDNYSYTDTNEVKWTFNMNNGTLESVTISGATGGMVALNGTYAQPECIAAGTMISMPGGKQKAVEELEIGDIICTFDHETGEVSSAPVCFIWESKNVANAFTLTFEDDVEVTVIEEHGFYDKEEQKYVFINLQNAEEYIGHHFYNADTNSCLELKNCEALSGNVDAYAIITSGHLNHMSNGMLSMCDGSVKVLANIFEYDDQMKFDADKKKADIEIYGLTSKEKIMEFEGFFESDYDDYNLQYLNVAIGKGLTTWEWIKTFSDYCVANGL